MNRPTPSSPLEWPPTAASTEVQETERNNTPLVVDSDEVLQGRTAVVIAHRGVYYRLQATRQGKLILTK
jgi:hemin uptake protein HemP